jgi:predicted transcriptional regulator
MKNRSRNEIIAAILEIINRGGSTKTKIMYGAFLSYTQLNQYVSFLLEMDMIALQKRKEISSFIITEKGTHFLNIHDRIHEMITTIQTK